MGKPKIEVAAPAAPQGQPSQPTPQPQPQPQQQMDVKDAINKMIQNTVTIGDHLIAIKMVGKGLDISAMETANNENRNLVIALANFIRSQTPARVPNRAERRLMERQAKKLNK